MSGSDYSDNSFDEEAQQEDLRKLKAALESTRPSRTVEDTFTNEEIIECINKVKVTISINKQVNEKINRLEKLLFTRLKECRSRLGLIHEKSLKQTTLDSKQQVFRYVFCGKPYFRDKDNFPAPDNEDTIAIEKLGLYDYSNVTCLSGWTVKDKSDFLKQIQKFSQRIRKEKLESKLADLRRISRKNDSKAIQKEMLSLKKEVLNVNRLPLNGDLVLPLYEDYDWEAIANALGYRHSPEEYRNLWKLFLHPSINKKSWEKSEHGKLCEIAKANQLQDWDKIAKELKTGRTGYQCFVYYRTNMGSSLTGQKWTKEEEEYLRRLIDYYREDNYIPWGKVSSSMEFRTKIQIYNKYSRLMELRKGRFLPEEDTVLLTGVAKLGTNFKQIAKYVPGRSAAQLRTRYNVLNSSTRTSVVWTVEEDKKLIQLMANQDSTLYINYANLTPFFPDKDRTQIRARYVTLVKWMKKHPNRDVARAPRRGARRLTHGRGEGDMKLAIEKLKKRIKSEIEIKKATKLTKDSAENAIDDSIVAALVNEPLKEESSNKFITESNSSDFRGHGPAGPINEINLRKLLILLKSKLSRQLFETSSIGFQYPRLKQADTETYCVKVKSYSKKCVTNIIKASGQINPPDIWGNNKLTTSDYVLPPNYATITGCRRLMAFASTKTHQSNRATNLNQYINRNVLVKEQIHLFMERFNTLFLWPMLLSNEPPKEDSGKNPAPVHVEKYVKRRERLLAPISVVIPNKVSHMVNEKIDLPSTSASTTVKPKIGNDDFMFIEDVDDEEINLEEKIDGNTNVTENNRLQETNETDSTTKRQYTKKKKAKKNKTEKNSIIKYIEKKKAAMNKAKNNDLYTSDKNTSDNENEDVYTESDDEESEGDDCNDSDYDVNSEDDQSD